MLMILSSSYFFFTTEPNVIDAIAGLMQLNHPYVYDSNDALSDQYANVSALINGAHSTEVCWCVRACVHVCVRVRVCVCMLTISP